MPVRKVVTRKHKGMRLLVPSLKMRRMVQCESMLEADAVLLFDWSNDIVTFEEQPCIEYPTMDGTPFRYTPDFLVNHIDGSQTYIEIKPLKKLNSPKLRRTLNSVALHFERSGRCFKVLSEDVIRDKATQANHKLLNYHARPLPKDLYLIHLIDELSLRTQLTFEQMCQVVGERRLALQILGNQCFRFDTRSPLTGSTRLTLNPVEVHHATFQV